MKVFIFSIFLFSLSFAFTGDWTVHSDIQYGRCGVYYNGWLWFGTEGGVVRLNPTTGNYKAFTHIDGLGGLEIVSLIVDEDGYLWYAASNGYVGVLKDDLWLNASELAQNFMQINRIKHYDGNIWICTSSGLVRATPAPTTFTVMLFNDFYQHFADLPPELEVTDVVFLHDSIFVGTPYGLAFAPMDANLFSHSSWDTSAIWLDGTEQRGIKALEVHNDTIWALGDVGAGEYTLFRLVDGQFTVATHTYIDELAYRIKSLNDTLWIMSFRGLSYYNPASGGVVRIPVDGPYKSVYALVNYNGLLVAATRYGYAVFDGDTLRNQMYNAPLGKDIADISFANDGTVVMATHNHGINVWDGENWQQFNIQIVMHYVDDDSLFFLLQYLFSNIWTAAMTDDGTIWVGSYGRGLLKIFPDADSFEVWDTTNSSLETSLRDENYVIVSRLRVDPAGNLWVLSYCSEDNKPLKVWLKSRLDDPNGAISFGDPIPSNRIMDIDCDWDRVAVATRDGAALIIHNGTIDDPSDDVYYDFTGMLPSNEVYATAIGADGKVWFGTANGLAYFNPSGFIDTVALPIDLSATVLSLAADSFGNIWIGTLDGAAVFMPDGYFSTFKSAFSDDAPENDKTPLFDDAVGTIVNTVLGGVFCDGRSGDVWFGFNGCAVVLHSPYSVSGELKPLLIYPNPAVAKRGIMPTVYIADVPADAPLLIYNAAGEIVRQIEPYWKKQDGVFLWDCKNNSGKPVSAGVYAIVAPSKNGTAKGKLLLIR